MKQVYKLLYIIEIGYFKIYSLDLNEMKIVFLNFRHTFRILFEINMNNMAIFEFYNKYILPDALIFQYIF